MCDSKNWQINFSCGKTSVTTIRHLQNLLSLQKVVFVIVKKTALVIDMHIKSLFIILIEIFNRLCEIYRYL